MYGRIRRRAAVVVALAVAVGLMAGALVAQAAPEGKTYQLRIDPGLVLDGTEVEFTAVISNTSESAQLGAVEITFPFEVLSVENAVASNSKTWNAVETSPNVIQLTAGTQTDRLVSPETVSVKFTAMTNDINDETDDLDQLYTVESRARQANDFNDQNGGNDLALEPVSRGQNFVFRADTNDDGQPDALVEVDLLTHQIVVVSGTETSCSGVPSCSTGDTQNLTTITVTAPGCTIPGTTLVADATDPFLPTPGEAAGEAAAFHYLYDLDAENVLTICPFGQAVDVLILHDKALKLNANKIGIVNYYGTASVFDYDPFYVGDGNPLPMCDVTGPKINCIQSIENGKTGVTILVKAILLPGDPVVITWK